MSIVLENFLRYVAVDTQSQEDVDAFPSTEKQKDLGKILLEELKELGLKADMDKYGYVYSFVPATKGKEHLPSLGLIAHMDTSDEVSGKDVKPRIVKNYNGDDIVLNSLLNIVLSPEEFPSLLRYEGQDLIVTDGTTLLGADDKAGIAEIMAAVRYMVEHPEFEHGKICVAFTPDEEVGRGVDFFDVEHFDAAYGYTVDGGELGEIEYENFNAVNMRVEITGKSVHPGSAKGVMLNSQLVAMEFHRMLPEFENPAYTEGYEGFYHLTNIEGSCDYTRMTYILRDHDEKKLEKKEEMMYKIAAFLNSKYKEKTVVVTPLKRYQNMKEQIIPHMHLIENAKLALSEIGVEPEVVPIRGGTDGARLSFMGLPCPNLCAGGANFHGRMEYIPVGSLEKCTEMVLKIIEIYARE